MLQKIEVGSDIYVWTRGGVKPNVNTACVISAHGGQSIIDGQFDTPRGVKLWFFAPHGYTLQDPSLMDVLGGKVKPYSVVEAGRSQDYTLSKYQGAKRGSGREKYTDIAAAGTTDDELLQKGFTQQQLDMRPEKMRHDLDVVTIRHRKFRPDPTLSGVLKALRKHGWTYTDIYCSFCRGPVGFGRQEIASWNAKEHKSVPRT